MESERIESDSLGEVRVPANALWGAQTQRSLDHFSIGEELIPREMIPAYALLKKACAIVNCREGSLSKEKRNLIVEACDEIIQGDHADQFPLHVWMTGSGTQFNMNVNEVIANRCCQLARTPLGSKRPVHPNDDVNMSQSSNDTFPTVMYMAAAIALHQRLLVSLKRLREAFHEKSKQWEGIVKIGRTHLQDATPLTLGQEFSGYVEMLVEHEERLHNALEGVYRIAIGGTAVGTGLNTVPGFDKEVAREIAKLTGYPFRPAANKFAAQGAHDPLVYLSATLKGVAVSLYKIANDIRLLSCGPRAGFNELHIRANEPGSSIMPGKVNPTQCEALAMVAVQAIANDVAVSFAGAGGYLEMNVYKPVMIYNVIQSIRILGDSVRNFTTYLVIGMEPNRKQIEQNVERSLMLVTALSPLIGYDRASQVAHYALDHDLTLREAALKLGFVTAEEFDRVVDPEKMVRPHSIERRQHAQAKE